MAGKSRNGRALAGYRSSQSVKAQAEKLTRDTRIWEMKRAGYPVARIARELQLSTATVDKHLARIFQEYRVGLTGEVEAKAGELISQYEYVRDEALEAWRESKQPTKRVSRTNTKRGGENDGDDEGVTSTTVSSEDQHGDPKYLAMAMQAMGRLETLLRVQDSVQVTVTHQGPQGGPVHVVQDINYTEMDAAKLGAYLAGLGQAALAVSQPLIALPPPTQPDSNTVEVEAEATPPPNTAPEPDPEPDTGNTPPFPSFNPPMA